MSDQAKNPNPDPLLDPTQAADWLNTHPKTLANQRSRGEGAEYVRIGGRVRYRTSALVAYAAARTVKTADTPPAAA